jgi:hypothetical protein
MGGPETTSPARRPDGPGMVSMRTPAATSVCTTRYPGSESAACRGPKPTRLFAYYQKARDQILSSVGLIVFVILMFSRFPMGVETTKRQITA